MEPRECTIKFWYPKPGYNTEVVEYKVEKVNYIKPYRHAKWLFTLVVNNNLYHSYEAKDDDELLLLVAKQSIGATQINIEYDDQKN